MSTWDNSPPSSSLLKRGHRNSKGSYINLACHVSHPRTNQIAYYIAELQDKRDRLMDFIKNLLLTKEARENLEKNVTNMEIKLMRKVEKMQI